MLRRLYRRWQARRSGLVEVSPDVYVLNAEQRRRLLEWLDNQP